MCSLCQVVHAACSGNDSAENYICEITVQIIALLTVQILEHMHYVVYLN